MSNMYDYLDELNEIQREAVINIEGPSLIIAGAGSGKTRVLTYRIAHLLRNGKKPGNILSLTFTNKAAKEMKERIGKVVGEETARYLWMGTFHSIFAKILRFEAESIGYPKSYTIYDTADAKNLIKAIVKELNLPNDKYKANNIYSRISNAKNNLITAQAYKSNAQLIQSDKTAQIGELHRIYEEYTRRCKKSGAMDFDDLLLNANILFRDHPKILEKYRKKFEYILVDEYQDTNSSQYLLIKKLAEIHNNVCVVGDDSQSIYSFRGAKIENIMNFKKDYPENRLFKLEQNYRSTQNIVNAANSIIEKNENRIPKEVWSQNENGTKIKIVTPKDEKEEAFTIANSILDTRLSDQLDYNDFAILYRTNAQSRALEEALRKRNIPYKIYSGLSFYQRKEVKDLLAYCRLIVNKNDDEALKRVINYPKRAIGGTTVEKLEKHANVNNISIWVTILNLHKLNHGIASRTYNKIIEFAKLIQNFTDAQTDHDAFELAEMVASGTGLLKDLYNDRSPEGVSKHENVQELLNGMKDFTKQNVDKSELTLEKFLEEVSLLTNIDTDKDDKNTVSLMTIHSSKGLEFENVYIGGMEEGIFPSVMSSTSQKDLEEERRLFYVAVTRAKKNLMILSASQRYKWGQVQSATASRFIYEIDEQYVDAPEIKTKKTNSLRFERVFSIDRKAGNNNSEAENSKSNSQNTNQAKPYSLKNKSTKIKINKGNNQDLTLNQVKRLKKIISNERIKTPETNFTPSPSNQIKIGMQIEHQRFGCGEVTNLEGRIPNIKATIDFKNAGQKQLLLKFAKLKIVD